MKNIYALTAVTATVLAASLFIAPASFAKAHDQSTQSEAEETAPGENVGSETVGPAQGLGAVQSDGKGKGAQGNTGKSGTAGRDSDGPGNNGQGHGNSFNE